MAIEYTWSVRESLIQRPDTRTARRTCSGARLPIAGRSYAILKVLVKAGARFGAGERLCSKILQAAAANPDLTPSDMNGLLAFLPVLGVSRGFSKLPQNCLWKWAFKVSRLRAPALNYIA